MSVPVRIAGACGSDKKGRLRVGAMSVLSVRISPKAPARIGSSQIHQTSMSLSGTSYSIAPTATTTC